MPDTLELFRTIDLGSRAPGSDGCLSPIGRRQGTRSRRTQQRPSTIRLLIEIRGILDHQLSGFRLTLQRLERHAAESAASQKAAAEALDHLRRRVSRIEQHLGIVETAETSHYNRQRSLL
jgi:hypothetical protein